MGSQDGIMVAASKHPSSLSALKWALSRKLVSQGGCIKLIHVRPPISCIPTPMGSLVPVEQVCPELVAAYMTDIESNTYDELRAHQKICEAWKVKVEVIIVQSDEIAGALLEQISSLRVKKFVMGTSTGNALMRKFKGFYLPGYISRHASDYCTIYVVSKGKLVSVKEGKNRAADQSTEAEACLEDVHTNYGNGQQREHNCSSNSTMKRVQMEAFISQPLSLQRNKAASAINSKRGCSDMSEFLQNRGSMDGPRGSQIFLSPFWSPKSVLTSSGLRAGSCDDSRPDMLITGSSSSLSSEEENSIISMHPLNNSTTCRDNTSLRVCKEEALEKLESTVYSANNLDAEGFSLVANEGLKESSLSAQGITASDQINRLLKGLVEDKQMTEMLADMSIAGDDAIRVQEHTHHEEQCASVGDLHQLKVKLEQAHKRAQVAEEAIVIATHKARELDAYAKDEARKREQAVIVAYLAKQEAAKEARNFGEALTALESARLAAEEEAKKRRKAEDRAYNEAFSKQKAIAALLKAQIRHMEYDYEDLRVATNGFSEENVLGEGGYGKVYLGNLHHTTVAIKVLKQSGVQGPQEFQREVEILSRMHHPNMVLLLGACSEHGCLIYEYLANGNLEDRLFGKDNSLPLSWHVRFRIAAEVATALLFLHASKPDPIVHRDLKPANILLDQNLISKIGDVGLARLAPGIISYSVTEYRDTTPVGTFAYIDPEYQRTGVFCPRSDVYALGVVMLQLLTGRGPIGLTTMVEVALEGNTLSDILDPTAGDWPANKALELAHLGLQCSEMRRKHRPDLETCILPKLINLRDFAEEHATKIMGSNPSFTEPGRVIPSFFLCPILKEVMEDPHIAADGYTYEYRAIKQWLQTCNTSPMTNLKVRHKHLIPNHSLRSAIHEWAQRLASAC